jgi:hypothetical protein
MFAAAGYQMAWEAARGYGVAARLGAGLAAVLLWAAIIPSVAVREIADTFHSNDPEIGYLQLAREAQRTYTGDSPVVVGKWPYFYSLETSASGLSIPWNHDRVRSDQGLFEYMAKYHAPFVLLTDDELKYWRPDWITSVPSELKEVARLPHSRLFRSKQ